MQSRKPWSRNLKAENRNDGIFARRYQASLHGFPVYVGATKRSGNRHIIGKVSCSWPMLIRISWWNSRCVSVYNSMGFGVGHEQLTLLIIGLLHSRCCAPPYTGKPWDPAWYRRLKILWFRFSAFRFRLHGSRLSMRFGSPACGGGGLAHSECSQHQSPTKQAIE